MGEEAVINFIKELQTEGIPCGAGYVRLVYLEPIYQKRIAYSKGGCTFSCSFYQGDVDYSKGICPVAEKMYSRELFLLPVCKYPHSNEDMDDVVRVFDKLFLNLDQLKGIN